MPNPPDPLPPLRRAGLEVFAASLIVLFQELLLIRWLPVEVRVASYFPNLILLSAFLGLGVGALRAKERSLLWLWPVSLVLLAGAAWLMSGIAFTAEGETEHLWLLYMDLPENAPTVDGVRVPLVILFVLGAASFVPLGQYVASRIQVFRRAGSSLRGYALDLTGSLAGVLLFTAVSLFELPPEAWFAALLIAGLVILPRSRRFRWGYQAAAVAVVAAVATMSGPERYSPYYALQAVPLEGRPDVRILANGSLHQTAMDMRADTVATGGRLPIVRGYRIPYDTLGRPIRKALVLGAGTGNDVATLLAQGAAEIHAVEIDPLILELGRELHPNRPYDDPRVTVFNVDARSYLNETEEEYDLIVFGTLDSMTRLSALSNVRLDNFVYTRESLAAARDHLTEDGGLVMYFLVGEPYIYEHLAALLAVTFDELPALEVGDYGLFNTLFMAGPAYAGLTQPLSQGLSGEGTAAMADFVPRDDWPYLYLPEPGVTSFYWSMIAILAGLSVLLVGASSRGIRASLTGRGAVDLEMFLYGFAFLLIETKLVTGMGLLWGSTWITSAVVFGSILVMVLIGTVWMDLRPMGWQLPALGLVAALAVSWLVPVYTLLTVSTGLKLLFSVLYAGVPILFASLCFAARFSIREDADLAFGWNLLGAVFGGLAEFFSMALGFKAMTLVAVTAYLVAFILGNRGQVPATVPTEGGPSPGPAATEASPA